MAKKEATLMPEEAQELLQVSFTCDVDEVKAPASYEECLSQISSLVTGAEMTLVMSSWLIGRLVSDAVENSTYGDGIINRLSVDLNRAKTLLYDMKRLYDYYPDRELLSVTTGVGWSSIRSINQLEDGDTRKELFDRARDERLTTNEVKELVALAERAADPPEAPEPPVLSPPVEEEPVGPTSAALRYFSKLEATVESMRDELADMISKLPEMKVLAVDEEATTEEDYEVILDKARNVSVITRALSEFVALNLFALNSADAFDEASGE